MCGRSHNSSLQSIELYSVIRLNFFYVFFLILPLSNLIVIKNKPNANVPKNYLKLI